MSDDHDHYFTASPASDAQLRERSVTLAGEQVTVWSAGGVFSPITSTRAPPSCWTTWKNCHRPARSWTLAVGGADRAHNGRDAPGSRCLWG
ncbi:hypothetical protein [Ornithinimicrobium sp. INDO-MA30-4]|uniref:hypothetical protein n=1 Tax=Ornithinimicrobium sp. INDO-MA30-4 TaxID=2908651 RepID=UPI0037C97635